MSQQRSLDNVIARLRELFPFPGYIDKYEAAIRNSAAAIMRHVAPGAAVLDFGSGPMDKTGALQLLGYQCCALDDLQDFWHLDGDNSAKICDFARALGIEFRRGSDIRYPSNSFDAVMMCDVLEHLHDSPRLLLNELVNVIKPGGHLLILVPNAANLRKRLAVMRGKTNFPRFETFYWCGTPFRGHVREYVKDDLIQLAQFLGMKPVELESCHNMLGRLPKVSRLLFRALTVLCPGYRDSWISVTQKPANWAPRPALDREAYFRKYFGEDYEPRLMTAARER